MARASRKRQCNLLHSSLPSRPRPRRSLKRTLSLRPSNPNRPSPSHLNLGRSGRYRSKAYPNNRRSLRARSPWPAFSLFSKPRQHRRSHNLNARKQPHQAAQLPHRRKPKCRAPQQHVLALSNQLAKHPRMRTSTRSNVKG